MSKSSVSKRVNTTSSAYLVQVYDAAKASGETTALMIALLRSGKIVWGQQAIVGPIMQAFKEGRMAGSLGVVRDEAKRLLSLKRWAKDAQDDDKRRTYSQQQAYRAAVSAWSYCALQAGMPHATTGATRKPRTPTATIVADAKSTAPIVLDRVIIPQATTFKDVQQFARSCAALMRKFENKNAKASFGEYRPIFDTFVSQVQALAGKEAAVVTMKTTTPKPIAA